MVERENCIYSENLFVIVYNHILLFHSTRAGNSGWIADGCWSWRSVDDMMPSIVPRSSSSFIIISCILALEMLRSESYNTFSSCAYQ